MTISASGGLGLLQMVLEPDNGQPQRGGLWDLTSVGEGSEAFFIRVWKPLPSSRVLKPWGEARNGKLKENNIY